ncbi:MAG: DUF58 domain-containing protein [Pseudomonadota bacterium]
MGILDLFRQSSAPRAKKRERALFDDEFQRKLEMLALVSRRVFAGRLRAERRSKKKGSGLEFARSPRLRRRDDFRSVDWNVYQRFGKLLVRLYEEEEDLSIYLIVDCSSSMGFGDKKKFDQARRLCAALGLRGPGELGPSDGRGRQRRRGLAHADDPGQGPHFQGIRVSVAAGARGGDRSRDSPPNLRCPTQAARPGGLVQ